MDQQNHPNASPIQGGKTCNCTHHKVVPLLVALIGLDFFLGAIGVLGMGFVNITWPILVIIAALTKMNNRCGCCTAR